LGVLASLTKLEIIAFVHWKSIRAICGILRQTQLPSLCELSLELRFGQDFPLFDPEIAGSIQELIVPQSLASQLRVARVTFLNMKVVRDVAKIREIFRYTKPGVLMLLVPDDGVLYD
jgi:hypothetical protein